MKRFIFLGTFVFAFFMTTDTNLAFAGDGDDPALIGRWVSVEGDKDLELFADGTARGGEGITGMHTNGSFKVGDSVVTTEFRPFYFGCFCNSSTFRFEGTDTLIMRDREDGAVTRFERVTIEFWERQLSSNNPDMRTVAANALFEYIQQSGAAAFDTATLETISTLTGKRLPPGAVTTLAAEH
jgi:hypothetical protein